MADCGALHQAQDTAGDEATDGPAHRVGGETSTASEPRHGEAKTKLALEAAMAEEMIINDAIGGVEAETRSKRILTLFPHVCCVGNFIFHFGFQE